MGTVLEFSLCPKQRITDPTLKLLEVTNDKDRASTEGLSDAGRCRFEIVYLEIQTGFFRYDSGSIHELQKASQHNRQ